MSTDNTTETAADRIVAEFEAALEADGKVAKTLEFQGTFTKLFLCKVPVS